MGDKGDNWGKIAEIFARCAGHVDALSMRQERRLRAAVPVGCAVSRIYCPGRGQGTLASPTPTPSLSLTLDLLRERSADTWWNFGHELKTKKKDRPTVRGVCLHCSSDPSSP